MPNFPAYGQSGNGMKKLIIPEPARDRNEVISFNIFWSDTGTETVDAGTSRLALFSYMPIPSFDNIRTMLYKVVAQYLCT
jgi:hypothetical protein